MNHVIEPEGLCHMKMPTEKYTFCSQALRAIHLLCKTPDRGGL